MIACPSSPLETGMIRDLLGSVDCNVQAYSAAGYLALTGPGSPLPAAMTALLTIYVALLGYRMLFAVGGARLSQAPLIAVKIGVILTLTLNWSVFQTLVFNFDANAPLQIGRVISRPMATGGSTLAADPVRGLQAAYDELNADAAELGKKVPQGAQSNEAATAADLRRAAGALVASTAGILAMAFIATGVLTAVGPVFIALFLFDATRGFFIGWVRALAAAVLAPMVCWITASLLLVILEPRIDTLTQQREAHAINLDAAAAASAIVLVFAAAQAMLLVAGLLVAGGFQLRRRIQPAEAEPIRVRSQETVTEVVEVRSRAQTLVSSLRRSSAVVPREDAAGQGELGAPGDPGREVERIDGAPRAVRLGETYRRGVAMRDRGRVGAAGRA